jgi:hypothetical protein
MRNIILIIILTFNVCSIKGQEIVYGDSTIVEKIKTQTSWIYENKDETYFLLTNQQLQEESTNGISTTAHSKSGDINRIVTISFTENGQLSAEWYFYDNKLVFVYQSFEYFNEVEQKSDWRNFKDLWGWESRYYFTNEELKYQKHKGCQNIEEKFNANSILNDAKKILNYTTGQIRME